MESFTSAAADCVDPVGPFPQLTKVQERLIEVVADDRLVLSESLTGNALQPRGEALMQVRALPLGKCLVRRVADEEVTELEGVARR